MKLNELTIKQTIDGLRKKEFSSRELVSECLEKITEKDGGLNSYLEVFHDAVEDAKNADQMLSSSRANLPPFLGIPLAIKDNILIKGKRATAGSRILANYSAPYDAGVIRKLKSHGAIFLGKTNMDEFAMGSSTENSAFGPTKNPHDPSRVPGGSSGGSAAAVAAHLCLGALGTDTGGSIRQPASFCGIVGLKPTYGAVSRHGLIAMASSLDQIGPMAKTVEDAEIIFEAIAGKDPFDSTSSERDTRKTDPNMTGLKNIRIGIPKEYFTEGLDPEVEKIIKSAIKKIEQAGAEIHEITLPHSEYALPAYYIVVPSEVSANLARFDGIRYGLSASRDADPIGLYDVYAKTRAQGFGAEVKRRIMLGTHALSSGYYDAYYAKAQKMRTLIRQDFENAFKKVDVILGPTTPSPAFKLQENLDDPLKMYLADIYTVAMPLAGIPAISLPAGFVLEDSRRLPVGMQLSASWFQEKKLFAIARGIEETIKSHAY